jgi:hypothetical protein
MPAAIRADGPVVNNCDEKRLTVKRGLLRGLCASHTYETVIVGAGTAGFAAAVCAPAEGLPVPISD